MRGKSQVAKRRKIRNMTRAEHRRSLEDAVRNQVAAVREMQGQVFLPKLNRNVAGDQGDIYEQTVEAGKRLLQRSLNTLGSRSARIISYYSRRDVQQAIYQYARGRKISVLRSFRPMFQGSEIREPEDILPIMIFYSQDPRLWPSIHGTVSRRNAGGGTVCDLVVEVDFKKSRERSFGLARPLIRLFLDLGIEFRVKFSGNASPHIIIPAEAFPRNRRKIGNCRNLYGKLLDFFRSQIKDPKTLDGSFRNPSHFLRMPYSLNENTGMVSLPIRNEDYERFSWKMADPDLVVVMEDWWSVFDIPEDAPQRTEELIDLALGRKKSFAVSSDRDVPTEPVLAPRMPDVLGSPVRMGMVKAGEEIAIRADALMREPPMQNALSELLDARSDGVVDQSEHQQLVQAVAQRYGVNRQDMQLLFQWSNRADTVAYYSRPDVQESIYLHVRDRCVLMEGIDEYLMLENPSDVSALAAYMVGGGVSPVFRCTNARYDPDTGEMVACDMVIRANSELANSVVLLLRGGGMPSFVLYNGDGPIQVVVPSEAFLKLPISQLPDLAGALDRHLRHKLRSGNGIYISLYDGLRPVPYSLSHDGERVNLPVRLEDVSDLSPDKARAIKVGNLEHIESFIPPDSGEKAGKFFQNMIS